MFKQTLSTLLTTGALLATDPYLDDLSNVYLGDSDLNCLVGKVISVNEIRGRKVVGVLSDGKVLTLDLFGSLKLYKFVSASPSNPESCFSSKE